MADENYSYAPKYVQIQNYILQKIESGEYTAGDKIPSEIELARQFDVSRLTVNTAVKELANSGIVERVQGKGTFINSTIKTFTPPSGKITSKNLIGLILPDLKSNFMIKIIDGVEYPLSEEVLAQQNNVVHAQGHIDYAYN